MKSNFFACLFFILLCACSSYNRESIVDKRGLIASDYRLYQGTVAWELAKAVQDEDAIKIKNILTNKPELKNFKDPIYGNSFIMLTILNQQMSSFEILIECGVDLNFHNTYDGSTPLIEAARLRVYDIDFAKRLIQNGANVNDIETGERKDGNSTRKTPLISAVGSGRLDFVELLVGSGAEINVQNEFGHSALSEAMMLSEFEIALFLLENGADYKRPIFYRQDYTVPLENQDKSDKGIPVYIVDILRESFLDLNSDNYRHKMKIVEFLNNKGVYYRQSPIPDFVIDRAKKEYPNKWQEYLKNY